VVVAPSLDAEATVKQFRTRHSIEYPQLCDADATAKAYAVNSYPFLFLVGKDRKVLWKANFEDEKLEELIVAALKAPEPESKTATPAAGAAGGLTVYLMKDGTKVKAQKTMDAGDEYSIKDENGKFRTIKKADVSEVKTE
jgi:hypothetical protein